MKILMLTPYLPYPLLSGGQIRTYNLLKQLAQKHEITLFALIKNQHEKAYIKEIEPFCEEVRVFKRSSKPFTLRNIIKTACSTYPFLVMRNHVPEAVDAIKQELSEKSYDLVHAETFYMMPHIPKTDTPVLLVEQTIEYLGYQSYAENKSLPLRLLLNFDIKKIVHWEKHYWRKADVLITMSNNDRDYIQQYLNEPKKVRVVSNGVDTSWFAQKQRRFLSNPTILYVGTFKWLPNVEAVTYLVDKIWPHIKELVPKAQLKIVGNAPTRQVKKLGEKNRGVEVVGRVNDIRDAFCSSHLLLAPVLSGKGTRYKILEAMASGTPIVATSTAVEGLKLKHKKHALVSDDPEQMADYAKQLINNSDLWETLSQNGRRFVQKEYDWSIISSKLDKIYQSVK